MRIVVDAQLPPALATWLRGVGQMADHVVDLGLLGASDDHIANYAMETDAAIVSKDADFVSLRRPDRFRFVWLRCSNATNRALLAWLEPRWPQVLTLLTAGERLIEVR